MDARYTTGFAIETPADFSADRALARQIALHGNYIVEGTSRLTALPATGSLIIVAPARNKSTGRTPVRVLAMVK
jgi:kynurenine formamidase